MLKETLARMEGAIRRVAPRGGKEAAELARLFAKLKGEIESLPKSHGERAQSIAGFAGTAAHEATRKVKSPELLAASRHGLLTSARGFEASHPRLVEAVNDVCLFLARMGI